MLDMAVHDRQAGLAERHGQLGYPIHDAALGCSRGESRRRGRGEVEDSRLALADNQRGGPQPTRSHEPPVAGSTVSWQCR
jgi:hypothetical protein